LLERGRATFSALHSAAGDPELAEATAERLRSLGQAVQNQVNDFARVLAPVLGGPMTDRPLTDKGGAPIGSTDHIGQLYRDWAWPSAGHRENERAVSELTRLLHGRKLGRTLVLGAGACGLAYDLHLAQGSSQTVAVDSDPYLLVLGERVVRGQILQLTEASPKLTDETEVSRQWTLQAPSGPLPPEEFCCLLADGANPPFADHSFDAVVTPWFIGRVPRDLPAFFGTLWRLLRPEGIWLNQGPLDYPEGTALAKRFARLELFGLAVAAGFSIVDWSRVSMPYLVSPLSGSGKIEAVLSFVARR
jgi:hypothetical protein